MPHERRYTVFEASNADLKEVYVTATSRSIFEAMANLTKKPPRAIAHWEPEHRVSHRSLEFSLSKSEADHFIERYVGKRLPDGWRFVPQASSA